MNTICIHVLLQVFLFIDAVCLVPLLGYGVIRSFANFICKYTNNCGIIAIFAPSFVIN